jgi:hypothetical protein
VEHLYAEGKDVDDALTFRVGGRPQLQVLDPVVGAIPVAMVDHLVCPEGTTEMLSHHQPMFPDLGHASNQGTEFARDRNLPVTVTDVSVAVALPDRPIRQRIAMQQITLVVGGAVALGLVRAVAIIDRTQSS